jgi:DNA-binding MarR family transcriptional regulator
MSKNEEILNLKTKEQKQDDAKKRALESIKETLEKEGLSLDDYSFSLFKKSAVKAAPNIQLFQTAANVAATTLTPSANKILMYILSIAEFENFLSMDQKTLNENLGISLRAVEYGIKELIDNGIIIKVKHPSDKRRNDYFLNPMQAWKGKTLNKKIAIVQFFKDNGTQLSLFGESVQNGQVRELEEIKAKKPSYKLKKDPKKIEIFPEEEQEDENPNDYEDYDE